MKMHLKSDNIEVMTYDNAIEAIKEILESLLCRSQIDCKHQWKDFIIDGVDFVMNFKFHVMNFKCGVLYIDFPDWTKSKKATINQKNSDDKCFQYTSTAALNCKEIGGHPERV